MHRHISQSVGSNIKMDSDHLQINTNSIGLKVQIKKSTSFNFFHFFAIGILTIGHVILIVWIINAIRNNTSLGIQVFFSFFGFLGLWTVNNQLRDILIFLKGKETIIIDDSTVNYRSDLGVFKKTNTLKLNEISKIELNPLATDKFAQSSNMFTQMKYGMIVIEKSKRKKIAFGHSLNKVELETLYSELKRRVKLPT